MQKTIVFDFDGVINSYRSGWQGIDNIPDLPVKNIGLAIERIRRHGYKVVVVSTRCAEQTGIDAINNYLDKHRIVVDGVQKEKPPCEVVVDDRAICFNGDTKNLLAQILNFKPWWAVDKFHMSILLGKKCLFIEKQIEDENIRYDLNKFIIMMDKTNNPVMVGTGIHHDPKYGFYGTILCRSNIFEGEKYDVDNGDYFKKIEYEDFVIGHQLITVDDYIEETRSGEGGY